MTDENGPGTNKSLCIAVAVALGTLASPARADDIQDLKKEIEALQRKVEKLEKKEDAKAPVNAVTGGDTPGSFKLPGTDTSVTIGGYVKLDAIWSNQSAGANALGDQLLLPTLIPVGPTNEKRQFVAHARETRLNFKAVTPTQLGAFTVFAEGDLFGTIGTQATSNSHNPRLRHAYGELGGFLAGQTWSNFMPLHTLPETLDFGGPVGQIFVRQAQVRWTQKFSGGQWAIALENPESAFAVAGSGTQVTPDDDRIPDITGMVQFGEGRNRYSVQGLLRNVRIDSAAAPAAVRDKWGGALGFAALFPVGSSDSFYFNLNAGNALGRYAQALSPDGFIDAAGNLKLANSVSGYAGYRHFWSEKTRSSLVLSGNRTTNPGGTFATIPKNARSFHLNLIHSPISKVNLGVELIGARIEQQGGARGSLTRLQFSGKYLF